MRQQILGQQTGRAPGRHSCGGAHTVNICRHHRVRHPTKTRSLVDKPLCSGVRPIILPGILTSILGSGNAAHTQAVKQYKGCTCN